MAPHKLPRVSYQGKQEQREVVQEVRTSAELARDVHERDRQAEEKRQAQEDARVSGELYRGWAEEARSAAEALKAAYDQAAILQELRETRMSYPSEPNS
jgi:hypothetical protein